MATSCDSDEIESLVTCSICLCEYDSQDRKPKFLPCSHTLCLKCLKELHKDFFIVCPLCRKGCTHQDDVSKLPNNTYALHMLKLAEKVADVTLKTDTQGKPMWCLTCGTVSKPGCSVHSIINLSENTVKNFESLLKLRDDIKKMKEEGQNNLALAINKRKEVQAHLAQVSLSLNMALNEVNQQEDQNNMLLMEMVSQLESSSTYLKPTEKLFEQQDPLLAELILLVDDSKPDDSLDTLREKMKKSIESSRQKLSAATVLAKKIKKQRKSRISVRISDDQNKAVPTWGLMEHGFNTFWPEDSSLTPTKRDFLMLSHIVFSIQKRGDQKSGDHEYIPQFKDSKPAKASLKPSQPLPKDQTNDKLDVSKVKFVLYVHKSGSKIGEIHIKLLENSYPMFVNQLAKACFHSSKPISHKIGKAFGDVVVAIPGFKYLADFSFNDLTNLPLARNYKEVGISLSYDPDGQVAGWSVVFPLQYFEHKLNDVHVSSIRPVFLIGEVTKGLQTVNKLSFTLKQNLELYTFVLETQSE